MTPLSPAAPDFRAELHRLLQAADTLLGQGESPANPGQRLILTVHLEDLEDCANRARAALAQPEPVAPTDEALANFPGWLGGIAHAQITAARVNRPPTAWRLARRNGELILQAGSMWTEGNECGVEWNDVPTVDLDTLDALND
jgi:hypothetical protein